MPSQSNLDGPTSHVRPIRWASTWRQSGDCYCIRPLQRWSRLRSRPPDRPSPTRRMLPPRILPCGCHDVRGKAGSNPLTPGGRYFVVCGRLWRTSNSSLSVEQHAQLVSDLMVARQDVGGRAVLITSMRNGQVANGSTVPSVGSADAGRYGGRMARPITIGTWLATRPTGNGSPLSTDGLALWLVRQQAPSSPSRCFDHAPPKPASALRRPAPTPSKFGDREKDEAKASILVRYLTDAG